MQRIRVQLSKDHRVRFVSHLDFLRVLTRSIRRAGLPVALTQGFNPHLKISFGSILPVGATSEMEYIDFELHTDMTPDEFKQRLNEQLPPGFHVVEARELMEKVAALQGKLNRVLYHVKLMLPDVKPEILNHAIEEYLQKETMMTLKKTKRGMKEINIRPFILDMELIAQEGEYFTLKMVLEIGESGSVRPEQVVETMVQYVLPDVRPEWVRVHRVSMYMEKDQKIITPWDIT